MSYEEFCLTANAISRSKFGVELYLYFGSHEIYRAYTSDELERSLILDFKNPKGTFLRSLLRGMGL